jgi:hypothetical protein
VTEERCERTELIVSQCAHCLGHTEPVVDEVELDGRKRADATFGPVVEARFPGRCPWCDETIRAGELIAKVETGANSAPQWVCAGCAP